jgi:hypothetical protein
MGYGTVKNVKQCFTYADAKYVHDTTKPIRGRSPEIRPLGERRDVDSYSVHMRGEDVEFTLYKTPVITYRPNGDVVVKTDGWSSISTHQFISQVLSVSCYGSRKNTVLHLRGQGKHIIPKHKSITMNHVGGNWRITQSHAIFEYRMNRKAANAVRKKYADFLNYAKGMVKLRSEMKEPHKWARRQTPYPVITIQEEELRGARLGIDMLTWGLMDFLKLDQPEETRHENYNEALAMVLRHSHHHNNQTGYQAPANEVLGLIDELLLRAHAQDVLVWTKLEVGQVPSGKYRGWMPEKE